MPSVSIIVPVYNAEKTIERCVNSILNQTYKDFELLLLDDGSTDGSGMICDDYAKRDVRVRVCHKENSGVSDTRNQGIDMAEGEYLQFVDSDDWIIPEATGFFFRAAAEHGCDMVIGDFYRVIGERVAQKGTIEKDGILERKDYAARMMRKPADFYYGVLWNKFYRSSIIREHQIKMDRTVSWCEDFLFNMEYVRHINTIYVLKVPMYYYVKTRDSLVSQGFSVKKTIQMKRMVFAFYNHFYKDVLGEEDYERRRGQVYRFLLDAASDGTVSPLDLPGNYKLGSERMKVSEGIQEGEGIFFDLYRERKLLEKLFDVVALRNDLTTIDIKILYYLSGPHEKCTRKEMSDILDISGRKINAAVQRLLAKEMVAAPEEQKGRGKTKSGTRGKQQEAKGKSGVRGYTITQEAENILSETLFGLYDLEQIQYEGFSQEEIELYERLNEKRKKNIKMALRT